MGYPGQYDTPSQPAFEDMNLNCSCGTAFIWTIGEQKFMQKLLDEGEIKEIKQPMRCPKCRAERKKNRTPQNTIDN